jgi:diadenosine tetraphosphatase ApaH/serine/threonine PP2A family protein phosphatase
MKVAVFADVHGNREALEAVLGAIAGLRPDHIVCGGDLAYGGPDPEGCVARIASLGIPCIRGNTDEWLTPGTPGVADPIARWTRSRLSERSQRYLAELPFDHRLDDLAVVHATPWSISDVVPAEAGPSQLHRMLDAARAAAVVYAHIHVGWAGRTPEGGLVVNSGSVGFPFDGDPRASFALLARSSSIWTAELHRVAYDIDLSVASFPPDHPSPAAWAARMRTGRRG